MFDQGALETFMQIALLALPVAMLATLVVLFKTAKSRKPVVPMRAYDNCAAPAKLQNAGGAAEPATDSPDALMQRLDALLLAADQPSLAPIYLQIAAAHRNAGRENDYLTALRSAAGCGAKHGPSSAHAQARLELAEVSFAAGDLTGACEQWQLARGAFLDDGQRDAHARVEKRMRDHGCPTDWVLTDF